MNQAIHEDAVEARIAFRNPGYLPGFTVFLDTTIGGKAKGKISRHDRKDIALFSGDYGIAEKVRLLLKNESLLRGAAFPP